MLSKPLLGSGKAPARQALIARGNPHRGSRACLPRTLPPKARLAKQQVPVTSPTISCLLLCWNHAPFLEQCLTSLAGQGFDEIVFLDNCSSDGSPEQARRAAKRLGLTVRWLANERPCGIAENFNRLLEASTGELVAVLSTDDWYAPGYVEAMRRAAAQDGRAGWFYPSGWLYFEGSGETRPIDDSAFGSGDIGEALRRGEIPYGIVGCCYRRSALDKVGGWDGRQTVEDRDLIFRLGQQFPVHHLAQPLIYYRQSSSTASADPAFMAEGLRRFVEKHRAELRDPSGLLAQTYRSQAARAIDQGRLQLAGRLLAAALKQRPLQPQAYRTGAYLLRRMLHV